MSIVIHNDIGVRVYVVLKKAANNFNMYPICATIVDKETEHAIVDESCIEQSVMILPSNQIVELDKFESCELMVDKLVEPLDALGSGDWMRVITNPGHKYLEID